MGGLLGVGLWGARGKGGQGVVLTAVKANSHGARPVYLIITMIKWIRTSWLSMDDFLSLSAEQVHRRANLVKVWISPRYRGTSLIRTPPPVGPYSSPVPRDRW